MITSTLIKVLIVVTSHSQLGNTGKATGYWLSEVSHAYYAFKEAGYEVQFVSPKGGQAPIDPGSLDLSDPINKAFLEDVEAQKKVSSTLAPEKIQPTHYQAIYFAGGHGTMWDFPNHARLALIAQVIHRNGGVISGVCHGTSAYIGMKDEAGKPLTQKRRVSGFSNDEEVAIQLDRVVPFSLEERLKAEGAVYQKGPLWQSFVSTQDRIVSGQNPASSSAVAAEVITLLKGEKL